MIMATVTEHLAAGNYPAFYRSKAWRRLRAEVLTYDRHECQICRARGKYTRADHVHHVMHVDKRPDLALRKTYTATGGEEKRNLISVCKACHEKVCHPERLPYNGRVPEPPLTPERW